MSKSSKQDDTTIVVNKKATHDYFIEERYEAGIVLEGWEIKAIREGKVQIKEAYVVVRNDELFLFAFGFTAFWCAPFGTALMLRRRTALGIPVRRVQRLVAGPAGVAQAAAADARDAPAARAGRRR